MNSKKMKALKKKERKAEKRRDLSKGVSKAAIDSIRMVEIKLKPGEAMGFSIESDDIEHRGHVVEMITPGGAVDSTGDVYVNDKLLIVNGTKISHLSHVEVMAILRDAVSGGVVSLVVTSMPQENVTSDTAKPIVYETPPPLSTSDEMTSIYALSCFGWGMSGAVALKADHLRWVPGQKNARYDIAGFVSLMKDWLVTCFAPCFLVAHVCTLVVE